MSQERGEKYFVLKISFEAIQSKLLPEQKVRHFITPTIKEIVQKVTGGGNLTTMIIKCAFWSYIFFITEYVIFLGANKMNNS